MGLVVDAGHQPRRGPRPSRPLGRAAPRPRSRGRAGRRRSAGPGRRGYGARCRRARRGPGRRRSPCPPRRLPLPWRAHSSEDLPDPLRPIRAVTVPGRSLRETSWTANVAPWVTVTPRASRPPDGVSVAPGASTGGGGPSRSRRPTARRRASRTVSGSGTQPAARPSSTSGGATGESVEQRRRGCPTRTPPWPSRTHQGVGEGQHPLEPVLGQHHRDVEVVDQPGQRGQHVLGRGRVERRGRLVEHQDPRVHGEHRAERDALLLAAARAGAGRGSAGRRCPAGRASPRRGGAWSRPAGRAAPCRRRAPPRRCR